MMQRHWRGIIRVSQCRTFHLVWVLRSDPRCKVRYWEDIVFHVDCHFLQNHVCFNWNWFILCIIYSSVMYSERCRGRGHGREHDFGGGHGSFGAGHKFFGGRLNASDKGPRHCTHCGQNNHISDKYWMKFGRSEWAHLVDSDPHAPCDTLQTHSSTHPGSSGSSIIILSQEEYNRLCQLEFSLNAHSATHVSSSGMHAYIAPPQKREILDSRASSHIIGTKRKFVIKPVKYLSFC